MGFLKIKLQREGVDIIAINDPVDDTDPTQRLITGIIDLFSEWEYHIRKVRIDRGWKKAKKEGKAIFRPPIGYKISNGKLVPDPKYDYLIKEMFRIAEEYPTVKDVQQRIKQVTQIEVEPRRIKYILTNPVYCGVLHLDGKVFDNNHEPLITKELFSKVSALFQ
jgi:site-specific DNA recombinase